MPKDVVAEAAAILDRIWAETRERGEAGTLSDPLADPRLCESIRVCVNSSTRSYRYVLPTQLVAKLADHQLDCRCLQRVRGGLGAFDARTVAHSVVVPFDQANERVLGGSPEPYVNNPLRVPEVSKRYRAPQRNRRDWDLLCSVLAEVQRSNKRTFTEAAFRQVLTEIYRRFAEVRVIYPAPIRISLEKCVEVIQLYLAQHSGGDRLLAVTSALFVVVGRRFGLFSRLRRASITAADAATGMLADLECVNEQGDTVLVVEVKDRELGVTHLRGKMPEIRERRISEVLFVAQQGILPPDTQEVARIVADEFVSGQNVYILDLVSLGRVVLALFGEPGRREFLEEVGKQLEEYRSDITHRRAWAILLGSA